MNKKRNIFVNVHPLTKIAKDRFKNEMSLLHSCYVVKTDNMNYYLKSLNKRYHFIVSKNGDKHWKVDKPRTRI